MTNNQNLARWDVVLLGGLMCSVAQEYVLNYRAQLGGLMGSLFS